MSVPVTTMRVKFQYFDILLSDQEVYTSIMNMERFVFCHPLLRDEPQPCRHLTCNHHIQRLDDIYIKELQAEMDGKKQFQLANDDYASYEDFLARAILPSHFRIQHGRLYLQVHIVYYVFSIRAEVGWHHVQLIIGSRIADQDAVRDAKQSVVNKMKRRSRNDDVVQLRDEEDDVVNILDV